MRSTAMKHFLARHARRIGFIRKLRHMISLPGDDVVFHSSDQYWKERYERGGDSGEGSYGLLARYKADLINRFCTEKGVVSAIEFGCGDGNQASMFEIRNYLGVDISEKCIAWANKNIKRPGWRFQTLNEYLTSEKSIFDLGVSLDVIYHLVEDDIYFEYIKNICEASRKYLLIYASNFDFFDPKVPHVRHRGVVSDIQNRYPEWKHINTEINPLSKQHDDNENYGSFAQFHIFEKQICE